MTIEEAEGPYLWCTQCGSKRRVVWIDDRDRPTNHVLLSFLCKDCGNVWKYRLDDVRTAEE